MTDVLETMAKALWRTSLHDDEPERWGTLHPESKKLWHTIARAALAALEANGFAVVPVKPTDAMMSVGSFVELDADYDGQGRDVGEAARDVWSAMLAASKDRPEA